MKHACASMGGTPRGSNTCEQWTNFRLLKMLFSSGLMVHSDLCVSNVFLVSRAKFQMPRLVMHIQQGLWISASMTLKKMGGSWRSLCARCR